MSLILLCYKQINMEGGQSGTYLRLMRASSDPRVSVAKTYRDDNETKMNISAQTQRSSSAVEYKNSSFSKLSVASPTSQLILQPFRCFTYVTAQSPIFPSLHLRHNSFSNPSAALPTSQLILQPFRCFTYITVHSPTLLSLLLLQRIFT